MAKQYGISISDAKGTKLETAVAELKGFQETIPDPENHGEMIPNPQSKQDFVNELIETYLRRLYSTNERRKALIEARKNTL